MVCSSLTLKASKSILEMLGRAPSKPAADSDTRSPDPTISKLRMCANGITWKSPAVEALDEGAVLIAIAFVTLQVVNRVPSRTLLWGAQVILILCANAYQLICAK